MFNEYIRDRESIVYGRYKHIFMTSLFTATHFDWIDLWVCVNDIVVVWQSKFTHSLLINQHIVFVWLFLFRFFKLRVCSIAIAINTDWEFIRSILCFTRIISGLSLAFIMFILFSSRISYYFANEPYIVFIILLYWASAKY